MRNATILSFSLAALAGSAASAQTLRTAAEWEPAIGAMVRFPWGVNSATLVEIAENDLLFVFVTSANQATANANLVSYGANMANVRYINQATSSIWTRDWGPSATFNESTGGMVVSDHQFIGYSTMGFSCSGTAGMDTSTATWGNDDIAPAALATWYQGNGWPAITRVIAPAYLVGGNFLMDGTGRAFYTCILYTENQQRGLSAAAVDAAMTNSRGITQRIVLPHFEPSGIQHIDCAIKPTDEETILVKRVPSTHPSFSATNAIAAQLAATLAPSGRPYDVRRLDMAATSHDGGLTNYTNSLILNNKVLMPAWTDTPTANAAAVATFQAALPGYEVVPLQWSGWRGNDALHCRVRAVWDPGMLRIAHRRLAGNVTNTAAGYEIDATIRPYSGSAIINSSTRVTFRVTPPGGPASSWISVPFAATPASFQYEAFIPAQPGGSVIEYFLEAADASGRAETLPPTAPTWLYRFTVVGDLPTCFADCDGSSSLSPADFTCFLGKYRAGDTTADCDASGGLSPADFTCFLSKYRAGCP